MNNFLLTNLISKTFVLNERIYNYYRFLSYRIQVMVGECGGEWSLGYILEDW